jgi:hypothetical protein
MHTAELPATYPVTRNVAKEQMRYQLIYLTTKPLDTPNNRVFHGRPTWLPFDRKMSSDSAPDFSQLRRMSKVEMKSEVKLSWAIVKHPDISGSVYT